MPNLFDASISHLGSHHVLECCCQVSQVIDQLFTSIPREDIDLFSCGHVIPPENLLGFSLPSGPTQKHLEFTFARRGDFEALDELGRILLNLARIVPGGIVVFFPSYRFEEDAVRRWQVTKQYEQIQAKKDVFSEPKKSAELAEVLKQYSAACTQGNRDKSGAMLLSVVGGKMSEGINFSDELARCVVMVGMPYPNARDPEIVEKMGFLEKRSAGAGRQFYESLCMKAINQSIGNVLLYISAHCKLLLLTRVGIPDVQEGLFAIKMISLPFCWSTIATQVRPFAVAYQSGSKSACSHQCHSGKCTCSSYNSIEQKETKVWQPRDNLLNRQQADVALHCQSVLFC